MGVPVALYLSNAEIIPIIKYFNILQDTYTLKKIISPASYSTSDKDAGFLLNHPILGYTVDSNLDEKSTQWEVLIIAQENDMIMEQIKDYSLRTILAGKKVIYFCNEYKDISLEIINISITYPKQFTIKPIGTEFLSQKIVRNYNRLERINVPIILVGGLAENTDAFHVLLGFNERMKRDGIRVSTLTKHPIAGVFGFNLAYSNIFNSSMIYANKIIEINRLIKNLEDLDLPDIILIEAPDVVMKYSDDIPNGFGIMTYMLSQAIQIDSFICCVPCLLAVPSFIEAISIDFKIRYGSPISAIHVSNIIIDSIVSLQRKHVTYAHTTLNDVDKRITEYAAKSNIPMFNVVSNGVDELYECIMKNII